MKIRQGFISNSSSSSFCIYGTYTDDINAIVRTFLEEKSSEELEEILSDNCIDVDDLDEEDAIDNILDNLDFSELAEILSSTIKNLECHSCYDSNETWIGLGIHSMDDDETKKQFQNRVEQLIKDELKQENLQFNWYEESWMS